MLGGRSNCLFFAVALYYRRWVRQKKSEAVGELYFLIRPSRLGGGPHFLVGERRRGVLRVISFKPTDTTYKLIPPLLFQGYAGWGDNQKESPHD